MWRIYYKTEATIAYTDRPTFKIFKKFIWKLSTEIEGELININKSGNSYRNLRTDAFLLLHSK